MVVTVHHVQIHVVEESIGVVVILVRLVVHAKPDILLPGVLEKMIEHVLHQHIPVPVPVVMEQQVLLLDVPDVHHAMIHIIYLEVLAWQDQYTRVLVVQMVLQLHLILHVLVVHRAIEIIN